MPKLCKIALTGGPCGGKTILLERAKTELEARGFTVLALDEIVTGMFRMGFWRGPRINNDLFVETTARLQYERERVIEDAASRMAGDEPVILLCDRGTPDARAYHDDPTKFESWLASMGTSFAERRDSYDLVVHLVTAADGAREAYNLNNAARFEDAKEAIRVDRRVFAQWEGHPNMVVIENASDGFEGKLSRAFDHILSAADTAR